METKNRGLKVIIMLLWIVIAFTFAIILTSCRSSKPTITTSSDSEVATTIVATTADTTTTIKNEEVVSVDNSSVTTTEIVWELLADSVTPYVKRVVKTYRHNNVTNNVKIEETTEKEHINNVKVETQERTHTSEKQKQEPNKWVVILCLLFVVIVSTIIVKDFKHIRDIIKYGKHNTNNK